MRVRRPGPQTVQVRPVLSPSSSSISARVVLAARQALGEDRGVLPPRLRSEGPGPCQYGEGGGSPLGLLACGGIGTRGGEAGACSACAAAARSRSKRGGSAGGRSRLSGKPARAVRAGVRGPGPAYLRMAGQVSPPLELRWQRTHWASHPVGHPVLPQVRLRRKPLPHSGHQSGARRLGPGQAVLASIHRLAHPLPFAPFWPPP